jgi:hypothetical protein
MFTSGSDFRQGEAQQGLNIILQQNKRKQKYKNATFTFHPTTKILPIYDLFLKKKLEIKIHTFVI